MKMIIAIVQDKDSAELSDALMDANVRTTKLSSTGGFLRAGNTTFLIGADDDKIDDILDIIKKTSHTRQEFMTPPVSMTADATIQTPVEVQVGGATVFVLPVDQFQRF
ncbi:nitrogen regulatory protein P-II [Companilactobacillus sp. RD055328]|uniref:cyclic-di-AMP receptor n=1 Tax=Companilactobacillus sp. RD055328 TaxID=2916634 RepID=UPI001FC81B29|nr:cyclic-di-AMP receptor [Companilactobacillus sp. RD055328]GKQ42155.1 nitrogen regulatory protein P-II [Companilactobacillus sp. RD055328]